MLDLDKIKPMQKAEWHTIKVGTRIDAMSFQNFKATCDKAIEANNSKIALDFEATHFVSMVGFKYIHELYVKINEMRGDLLLVSTSEKLKKQALIYAHKDIRALFRTKVELGL